MNKVKTILLVEDNEMVRDMLSRRLRRQGYQVLIAENGRDGVDKAKLHQPQLILMDMSLPVLDGWRAATELKATAETTLIPVIALTAHAMVGDREKSLEAGCDEYETKPVKFDRLVEKIEKLLEFRS